MEDDSGIGPVELHSPYETLSRQLTFPLRAEVLYDSTKLFDARERVKRGLSPMISIVYQPRRP